MLALKKREFKRMADSSSTAVPVTGSSSPPAQATDAALAVGAPDAEVDDGFDENDSSYGDEQYVP